MEVVVMATEGRVYLLLHRRGRGCVAGSAGESEGCSGWQPENGGWNPERGKGQPKITPYRAAQPGPHHTQRQIRRQCPFYDRIRWQYLNCPGRCTAHVR